MLSKYGRIVVLSLSLSITVFYFIKGIYLAAIAMLIGSGFVIYGYFKYGTVYLAFRQLKFGKIKEAEKTLRGIKDKNKLNPQHLAYYHFVWGYIYFSRKNYEQAIIEFEQALDGKIKTKHDMALVYCNLASLHVKTGKKAKAKEFLTQAKNLPYKKSLQSDIDELEKLV